MKNCIFYNFLSKVNKRYFIAQMFIVFCFNSFTVESFADIKLKSGEITLSHPRIFINAENKNILQERTLGIFRDMYNLMTKRVNHARIPGKMKRIRDYIYKYSFLYQMTGEEKWAEYAVGAMEKIPEWLDAYGGANGGYGLAIEGLAIGFDWCYDYISIQKKQHFISLINRYFELNYEDLKRLPDFHNYASYSQFAVLIAGLATYGDNPKAFSYLEKSFNIMEEGYQRKGIFYNLKNAIDFVGGTCNWEGSTYARHQIFSSIKYVEAWRTATNGKVNLWKDKFSNIENAGYYMIYSTRPDNKYENIWDVTYPVLSYYDINNMAGLQGAFKNGYFTSFIDKYYRFDTGAFKTDLWIGSHRGSLIFYILWYDPQVTPKNLNELAKTRRFGDLIVMRSGFNSDDTFLTFKSGIHYGYHSQLDHGSFTIFKNSPLAIDSGYNDSWRAGKKHNWSYWKRTVAHNSLLIYSKREKWPSHPRGNDCKNDGGQRMVFRTFFPPYFGLGSTYNPRSIDEIKNNWDNFRMGEIVSFESKDNYDYIRSDLTNAYNNKYSGWGNNQPKKVKSVEREFVYLRPDLVVVFDKVEALDPRFKKTWLLHSGSYYDKSGKPELNGKIRIIEGSDVAGIAESIDSDMVTITQEEGKLFVKTLLPEKHITRRIGGKGYEFWVKGENMKLSIDSIPKERLAEDPGAWRVEIEPAKNQKNDVFLNILYPCDANISKMPEIEKIYTKSKDMVGAYINSNQDNFVTLFNLKRNTTVDKVQYTVKLTDECKHFIFNQIPNRYYHVIKEKNKNTYKIKVQESSDQKGILSSNEGVVSFITDIPRKRM